MLWNQSKKSVNVGKSIHGDKLRSNRSKIIIQTLQKTYDLINMLIAFWSAPQWQAGSDEQVGVGLMLTNSSHNVYNFVK